MATILTKLSSSNKLIRGACSTTAPLCTGTPAAPSRSVGVSVWPPQLPLVSCGACRDTGRSTTRAGDRDDIRRGEARLGVCRGGGSREENRGLRETGRDGRATRGVGLHEEETGGHAREIGTQRQRGARRGIGYRPGFDRRRPGATGQAFCSRSRAERNSRSAAFPALSAEFLER